MSTPMTEKLVRFQQPEKLLGYLGHVDEPRIAALFDLDPDSYRGLRLGFTDQVRRTAEELLTDPAIADAVDRLPFAAGQHVAALGESTTADRLSWFEILRWLLALRRPADAITLTNLAVSGCTTTQALARLPGLAFHRPDWVLCMLGGNDAQRLGGPDGPTLVSATETERNLRTLRDLAGRHDSARWIWLTPTAVDETRAADFVHFQRAGISWTNADIDAVARFPHTQPEPTVETRSVTAHPDLHLDDGVHLTLDGQRAVTVALVTAITESP